MKNLIVLIAVSLLMVSCAYVTYSDLAPEDYGKYIETASYSLDNGPLAYSVIKGENPANEYNWTQVVVSSSYKPTPWFTMYYKGDKALLLKGYFPDADCIMSYQFNFYIGYKREVKDELK